MFGKKKSTPLEKELTQEQRRNPFAGTDVQDIYSTKNNIAVTTVKTEKKSNVNLTVVKTKYYKRNDSNMRSLRKVQKEVRRGRNGGKYEKI